MNYIYTILRRGFPLQFARKLHEQRLVSLQKVAVLLRDL
jgi:hypothetical protein